MQLRVRAFYAIIFTLCSAILGLLPALEFTTSIDSSWAYGLSYLSDAGAVFGEDVVFTYGPLHYLITGVFNTIVLSNVFSVFLSGFVLYLVKDLGAKTLFVTFFVLLFMLETREALLYLCFVLVIVTVYMDLRRGVIELKWPFLVCLITMSVISVFIKKSFLPLILLSCGSYTVYLFIGKRYAAIALSLGFFLGSIITFWWAFYGNTNVLPYLLETSIIAGYGANMTSDFGVSVFGVNLQFTESIVLFGLIAYLSFVFVKGGASGYGVLVSLALVGAIFLSFKIAVVRHGGAHSLIVWLVLAAVSSLLLDFRSRFNQILLVGLLAALPVVGMLYQSDGTHLSRIAKLVRGHSQDTAETASDTIPSGTSRVLVFVDALPNPFPGIVARYKYWHAVIYGKSGSDTRQFMGELDNCLDAMVEGAVDIYPTDINCLLANHLEWSPRPVFQSYSAYTPELAKRNLEFLVSDLAPTSILIQPNPIDSHIPAIEDGLSWLCMKTAFEFARLNGSYVELTQREGYRGCSEPRLRDQVKVAFDHRIGIDCEDGPQVVSFQFERTWVGSVLQFLYKNNPPSIRFELCTGEVRDFTLPPGYAASPFLLSPLVEDAEGFIEWVSGTPTSNVRSITIGYGEGAGYSGGYGSDVILNFYDL